MIFNGIALGFMESPPQEDKFGGGGQFYQALGTLNFYLLLERLSQMGGLKFFKLFWGGQQAFLFWGMGGVPLPTGQKCTHPSPTRKSPSQ